MAWIATDNFDSYPDGDLSGQNGGTDWTAAWSGGAGFDVQGTVVYQGAKAVSVVRTGAAQEITRDFTAITAGSVYIAVRVTSTALESYLMINEGATSRGYIKHTGGVISIYDNGGGVYQNVATGLSADTWYIVNIEFDDGAQPNNYRARVYNGSWGSFSSWYQVNGGSYTNISRIRLQLDTPGTGTAYYDLITPTDPVAAAGPSNLKSLDGNTKANIKSYNGNLLANIKSIAGNA